MNNIVQASPRPEERSEDNAKLFPGILPSVGWIALYFALQFLVTAIVIAVAMTINAIADPEATIDVAVASKNPMLIIWGLIASAVVQLGLMWLYLRKGDRAASIGLTRFSQIPVNQTIAIAVATLVVATSFNALYAHYVISGQPMQDEMAKLLASIPRTPLNIGAGLLAIAVIAPLIEELLFRGLLQKSLMHYVPGWAAIGLSAFVFSVVHLQLLAMPALMALGAAFGFIYHKTGSLRITIILHMVNNALALVLSQAL